MKWVNYLLPFAIVIELMSTNVYAQTTETRAGQQTDFERESERDERPVREFVQSKENIDLEEKDRHLEISGDVRFEWRHLQEKGNVTYFDSTAVLPIAENQVHVLRNPFRERYQSLRGGNKTNLAGLPISNNDWDVEFNLKIKYTAKRAWAQAHLQFDNSAGIRAGRDCVIRDFRIRLLEESSSVFTSTSEVPLFIPTFLKNIRHGGKGSGEANAIHLKRAFMGYNIWADGVHRLDIEIGRRKLDDYFDSILQFGSRFDGVMLKYATKLEGAFDFYTYAGAFIVDERVDHISYATEIGFLNLWSTGFDLKYSFINWPKFHRGINRCFIHDPAGFRFMNSQVTLDYRWQRCLFGKKVPFDLYGAVIVNHAAKKSIFTKGKKANIGWYAGLLVGEVEKAGDWSFEMIYEYLQAQAVPEFDDNGIHRGNELDENLTDIIFLTDRSNNPLIDQNGHAIVYFPRRGNTNYKGWRFEFLYAITDNFSLDVTYEFTHALDRRIGGRHYYSNAELEAIYAF
jgi:hypothetical protein